LYSEYAEEFRAEEDYLIVVESDRPERNRAAVDALVKQLLTPANNPFPGDSPNAQQFITEDVFYRADFEPMQKWFLYYLSRAELSQIGDSLKEFNQLVSVLQQNPRLATFFDAMNQMLEQMTTVPEDQRRRMEAFLPTITAIVNQLGEPDGSAEKWRLLSPWASAFFSEEMLGQAEQQMKWQGYHVFQGGRMFVILLHPRLTGQISGPDHHAATVPKIRRILNDVRRDFPDVKLSLTGEPVLDNDEMEVSQRDATKSSVLTLILIAVVIVLGFRDWLRMLLSICCLIMVIAVTMGYTTLVIGHLNIITITFAVMILGLGEDLGVQFISRYEEELCRCGNRFDAVRGALQSTGPSIVTAGVTNAAAFFAMVLSGFKGVTELGMIAGGGMLLATLGMTVLLPALLLSVRRRNEPAHLPVQVKVSGVERALLRRPWVTVAVCAAITTAALVVGWRAKFDFNVLKLQSRGLESVDTELRLLKAGTESSIFASVVCDDLAQTRVLQHSLTGLPTVVTVHSIAELIPEEQEAKVPLIREIRERVGKITFTVPPFQPGDADAVVNALGSLRLRASKLARDAAERGDRTAERALAPLAEAAKDTRARLQETETDKLALRLGTYERRFYDDLQDQLALLAEQADRPMTVADVTPDLRRVLVGKTGKFLVRVFPKENVWELEPLERFVADVQSVAPKATGTPLGLHEFVNILVRGYIKAALWAFLVIAIMVFVDLRGAMATVLTLVPLVVGTIWMIGVMAVFGIRFNPANILTLPLMVGIGVAYGIYIVQRYREDGEATFYGKSTGRAVMLSALTAVIAFGSLLIGAHRGICSLGLVMTIGVSACLVAALVLLPALLEIARRKGWKV
ncbi:MAG: MMPL family transporter, partial [Verrucomicrobiia bacterium]